jgi:hypothetical protein
LWSFGTFFPFWYVGTKKNVATLYSTRIMNRVWPSYNEKQTFAETFPFSTPEQGCQMVYFKTQNTNLGKYSRAL